MKKILIPIILVLLVSINYGQNTKSKDKIAFYSTRDGHHEIYVMNTDGSNVRRLTFGNANNFCSAYSLDGKKIAFLSDRDGNKEIYLMNADGSEPRRLTNNPADDYHPKLSPNGKQIAFVSKRDGNPEIYTFDADGRNLQRLTNNNSNDAYPSWSPDGNKIAFNSERDGIREIYVMNKDGSNQKRLTNSQKGKFFPAWSPDGKKIAFFTFKTDIKKRNIYIMNADGNNIRQITNTEYIDEDPVWSPDSRYIVFQTNRDGNYEIYVMNADGSNQRRLTHHPAGEYWPSWASGEAENSKKTPQTIDELKTKIDSLLVKCQIPGVAVAIVSADSILWIGTFGFANLETGEPVTENTHFCIGSCTKSFTGLGFLKLLDEGRIDLNTPVREIVPEIKIDNPWADTNPVRIVHLLEHTSGFEDSHINWFYFKEPVMSIQQALEEKAHLRKVRWQPGTRFCYSSPGITLAGYVLEKVSGQRYEDFMKQALLKPIGMRTTTIGSSKECKKLIAVGYGKYNKPFPVYYDYDEPAGALNSSIREMALFVKFMLNKGTVGEQQIISDSLFDKIGKPTTTLAARAGLESGYGFGIGTRYEGGAKWHGHGGAVPGFLAEYYYNPDHGLGFVVMQNSFDMSFYDDVFFLVWDYMNSHVASIIPHPQVSIPANEFEKYCGYYESRNPRMRLMEFSDILSSGVNILYENDTLYSKGFMGTKQALIPVSQNLFRNQDQPEASKVFFETPDGRMVYASKGSYYEKTASWKPHVYRILVFGAFIVMISSIVYSLFWIPVYFYKRWKRKNNRSHYIRMRLIPLFAVLSLVIGITTFIISEPSMLEIGQRTLCNVIFFISTLFFAALSVWSLFTSYRSFFKPVKKLDRIYTLLLSSACFGMTLYFSYWGIIGLRLWAY